VINKANLNFIFSLASIWSLKT